MADKVALQPSINFDADSTPSPTRPSVIGVNLSSASTSQSINPKDSNRNRAHEMEPRPQLLPVSSLISPPEPSPYESFSQPSAAPTMATPVKQSFLKPPTQFPSPPVSPETPTGHQDRSAPTVKDPILYPAQDNASITSSQPPLFVDEDEILANRVVDEHLTARSLTPQFREASPPRREDYKLALEFKSQVAMLCHQNPRQWLLREREYLLEDQRRRKAFAKIAPAPAHPSKTTKNTIARVPKPKAPRAPRAPRATPTDRARQIYGSMTPEPGRRHNVGSTREDKNFDLLPDFCPPLSTLPNRPNSLKVDWKGAPIDLRDDPHRHLLHEDELSLAANLRLDCATYLTSKRRIFSARLDCLRKGKEFRKTDSQQACKIDVNKASKLWAAFDKVGWLKPDYVAGYL